MPQVTVVIPAYNAASLLSPTLKSALASTCHDIEILVIDDGSRDNTAEVAAAHGPRVRVIRQENGGMSMARNRGIAESDSEFVALLDADDLWHPRKLELQLKVLDAMPEAGLSYTEFFSWDGSSRPNFAEAPSAALAPELSGWIYHQMLLTNFVLPSSALFRRSAMAALGPFSCANQQTDDWEYVVRASRLFPFAKLCAALVAYRQSPGSLSKRVTAENATELMRESLISKYGLVSPQGVAVDARELERRRYKGWRDFADSHVARGSAAVGLKAFARLLVDGPWRSATALTLLKSSARRLR